MTEATLYVSKDSYTRIKAPDTNYGSEISLQVRLLLNDTDTSIGYMEFDLTSIPDAQYVSNATLRVRGAGGGVGDTIYLKSLDAQFTENTITWNNAPSTNSDWSSSGGLGATTWNEVDVDVSWIQSNLSSNWVGIEFSALVYDSASIFSKEYSSGVYTAELVITYSTTPNEYYVKASGGSDSNDGGSWANAWATIDKAATTVADGKTVHIGFGNYSQTNAQDIAPVNVGSIGIKYLPETATTGGGTGEVKITLTT